MAHFAEIDENGIVKQVLVVPDQQEHRGQEYLVDDLGLGGRWIQTSYNGSIRKRFAGIGMTYDELRDAFIHPKPFESWFLDELSCTWQSPVEKPTDGKLYIWNEETLSWDEDILPTEVSE
jgi:hypothetical protein